MLARKRSRKILVISVSIFGVLLLLGGAFLFVRSRNSCDLSLSQGCVTLERADTADARTQGLSGRTNLATDQAMLFVYKNLVNECYWMKDMNFSIDMVWLDAQKKIITMHSNVAPSTYPDSFCPDAPAQYVLEFPAGTAERNQLQQGQQLQF